MSLGYQLKITIKGSKPPIWRRIIIPERITFYDLDNIIQALFGWTHSHLFEFYLKEWGSRFTDDETMDMDDNSADACVDMWIEEGDTFSYTYDFGDNWEHTIKVEKIVEYDKRYPIVLKYKGSNMIEDCGGIWGFEEWKDQAEPFQMDKVNQEFQTWNLPVADMELLEEDMEDEFEDELDFMLPDNWQEMFTEQMEHLEISQNILREQCGEVASLKDVFCDYSKNVLMEIAQLNGFTRYSKFKKSELAEWLKNKLLEKNHIEDLVIEASREEVDLFESAIEKHGICITEDLIQMSVFLTTYGAFLEEYNFYRVPLDVQEKYQQVQTPEFQKKLEDNWNFTDLCNAIRYLYGVLPVSEFTNIYNYYEDETLTEDEIIQKIKAVIEKDDCFVLKDEYFMDWNLEEDDMYLELLKVQKDTSYYMPKDKEELLSYGTYECQEVDKNTEFFINYLQLECHLEQVEAMMCFYELQEGIRMNADPMELIEVMLIKETAYSEKKVKKAMEMLIKFSGQVRKWDYRGHTLNEINQQTKIITFPFGKKVYPNDKCPCGSGKKYKHCCQKKK